MDFLKIDPVAIVAERKILEAMEQGLFDDLPGNGKPLPEDEFANLPDEVRLCARILRSSSFLEGRGGSFAGVSASLLDAGEGGASEAFRGMRRLDLRLGGRPARRGRDRGQGPGQDGGRSGRIMGSPYLGRILSRLF